MDEMTVTVSMDQSEARSGSLGEKRPLVDDVRSDLSNKKARVGGEVRSRVNVKKVAEVVLVLATMGKMRAGRKPTPAEVKMMAVAREKLAELCKQFAPQDVFPRDAFGTIIEDLDLNRLRETKLGIRPSKMSIAEKLQLTKRKMEKTEVFPLRSATYTPEVTEPDLESQAVRVFPSGKPDPVPISSGGFQHHSTVFHASMVTNSRTLQYQLPTSEVRPGRSSVLTSSHLGRHSTASPIERPGRPHLRSDERSNANSTGDHRAPNTHKEIGKIVQKILQPHITEHKKWTPPSRDYMNKALTCQTCNNMIYEVDTLLVCDACEKGYHLRCLHCNPKSISGDKWNEWYCAKCLAISNGKPFPPKYGHVMRNINTTKMASTVTMAVNQEKELQPSDGDPGSPIVSSESVKNINTQINGTHECRSTDALSNQKVISECNPKGEIKEDEIVKISETCTALGENGGSLSGIVHDVEWVGGVLNEADGKSYYLSCCINGTIYHLQDYALFTSNCSNFMPNKLQGMWEDNKTGGKWVTVTRCFFPDNFPEGVRRPCATESNEVYESNHETTLAAGLIHGPCQVLPPPKFAEERVMQSNKPKPLFLCKWFYDEKKRLFRDVTC